MAEFSVYEVWQGGMRVASCCGPDHIALKEISHYAALYEQEGPIEIKKRKQRGGPPLTNGDGA